MSRDFSVLDTGWMDDNAIPFILYNGGFLLINRKNTYILNGKPFATFIKDGSFKNHKNMYNYLPDNVSIFNTIHGRVWLFKDKYPVFAFKVTTENFDWKKSFMLLCKYLRLSINSYVYWDDTRIQFNTDPTPGIEEKDLLTTIGEIISPNRTKTMSDNYYERLGIFENYLLYNMLSESKQVGDIYHFTHFLYLVYILKSNSLRATARHGGYHGLSFTRNKNLWFAKDVRITFDGNKLSNNYKIKPYNDIPMYGQETIEISKDPKWNESEEKIRVKEIGNIKNYIKSIELNIDGSWINLSLGVYKLQNKDLMSANFSIGQDEFDKMRKFYINELSKYNIPISWINGPKIGKIKW